MVDPIQIGVLVDSAANHRLSALAAAAGASSAQLGITNRKVNNKLTMARTRLMPLSP